jgi:hypothetical protein
MNSAIEHSETALDQLRCADDQVATDEEQLVQFLVAAAVHAALAIAAAIREASR